MFVARQPIFDRDQKLFGYELLFRQGVENFFSGENVEAACKHTLDTSLLMGLDLLCGDAYAFINCTREVLLKGYMNLLSPRSTAVEILESVPPDREVREACLGLKAAGYLIALDDFIPGDAREPLAGIADIVKVDLIGTPRDQWKTMVDAHASERTRVLAEKVETPEEFRIARDAGFVLFQGYFFQKPVVFSAQEIPASQMNYLRMLQAIHKPELDWKVIETLIKQEASLCYRLLRYLNSARFAFCSEIRSVRHALSMLGETEIRRWVSMVATLAAARNKPDELVQSALVRARFYSH
jgi:c-di-GMP-related signal transduction protein